VSPEQDKYPDRQQNGRQKTERQRKIENKPEHDQKYSQNCKSPLFVPVGFASEKQKTKKLFMHFGRVFCPYFYHGIINSP